MKFNNLFLLRLKLDDLLKIDVYSQGTFTDVFWIAINRLGIVEGGKKRCDSSDCKKLELEILVTKEMLPKSTFYVFACSKDLSGEVIVQNKVDVVFDQLTENYVSNF